jgi:hypothetical protein
MKRQLPRYKIGIDEFEVDMRAGEMRLLEDPRKTLAFFKMDGKGDKFNFLYDNVTQKMVLPGYKINPDGNQLIEKIVLPVLALDPKFRKEVEQEAREAEQLIHAGKSIYNRPGGIHEWTGINDGKAGPLPMVNLYGTDFFLDLRMKELRQVDNHANTIPFKALQPEEFHFTLLYDATSKNAFNGSIVQAIVRDDVKALLLPPLDKMIRDGIERHERKIRTASVSGFRMPDPPQRTRKKGRGI